MRRAVYGSRVKTKKTAVATVAVLPTEGGVTDGEAYYIIYAWKSIFWRSLGSPTEHGGLTTIIAEPVEWGPALSIPPRLLLKLPNFTPLKIKGG